MNYSKDFSKRKKERARIEALPLKLIPKIKLETLSHVQTELSKYNSHWNTHDGLYRIFHRSFKMYNLSKETLIMWELFLSLFKLKPFVSKEDWEIKNKRKVKDTDTSRTARIKNHELKEKNEVDYHNEKLKHVIKNLKKIGADPALITQVKMLKNKVFTLSKNNNQKAWAEEGLIMAGAYSLSKKIIESSLKIINEWTNKKGFLWTEKGYIEIDDALVMSSLGVLNLRYNRSENIITLLQSHFESLES